MKLLTLVGLNGVKLAEFLVNVRGDDTIFEFNQPINYPVVAITLIRQKKEGKNDNRK